MNPKDVITIVLLIAATICFLIDAFAKSKPINFVSLGYACVTGAALSWVWK